PPRSTPSRTLSSSSPGRDVPAGADTLAAGPHPIVPRGRGDLHPVPPPRPRPPGAAMSSTSPVPSPAESSGATALGVDVGGTGIKVGVVDLHRGVLIGNRHVRPTPRPATPEAVADTIGGMVGEAGWHGPVGVALPSVIHEGVARIAHHNDESWIGCHGVDPLDRHPPDPDADTSGGMVGEVGWHGLVGAALPSVIHEGDARIAHNIDESWIGCGVVDLFDRHLPEHAVVLLNDADAAGLTEVRYGAAEGIEGLVVLLTFGTGIGSALLIDGRLIPNTEFGHMLVEDVDGRGVDETEHLASASVRTRDGLSYEQWAPHVSGVLRAIEELLWPRAFVLGGGV